VVDPESRERLAASSFEAVGASRRASRLYQAASPWAIRSKRVSPPDAERTVPGEYCSTSRTCQPRRASSRAVEAPKTPAPTTTALFTAAA
jgi:hypothetical protein